MLQARILEKSEEHLWEDFIKNHPQATIHQTPNWGHFQAAIPSRGKYWILVLANSKKSDSTTKILAGTLLVRHKLPKGYSWLYAARGPLLDYENKAYAEEQMAILLAEIKKIAATEKAIFLRIDPPLEISAHTRAPIFPGFHSTSHGFQPQHTLVLDLTKTEQEILTQMKPKGRYNIKIASREGVQICIAKLKNPPTATPATDSASAPLSDLTAFYKIFTETTSRDGFRGHDQDYYEKMLHFLAPALTNSETSVFITPGGDAELKSGTSQGAASATPTPALTPNLASPSTPLATSCPPPGTARLYLAEYNNKIVAGAIITYFADTATYYFGASSSANRNVMAPYLLHWQAIQDAKKQGYKFYDFFGIAPTDAHKHPWAGVTDFKKKFGGTEISYAPAQEHAFKKLLYKAYQIYKKLPL